MENNQGRAWRFHQSVLSNEHGRELVKYISKYLYEIRESSLFDTTLN
jgi:hypothetical protein